MLLRVGLGNCKIPKNGASHGIRNRLCGYLDDERSQQSNQINALGVYCL